jgi:hypothetical protein
MNEKRITGIWSFSLVLPINMSPTFEDPKQEAN